MAPALTRAGGAARRGRPRRRHRRQARRAPRRHPAAPGLLLLRLRRRGPAARHPTRAAQGDLPGVWTNTLLRPPRPRRGRWRTPYAAASGRSSGIDARATCGWCCRAFRYRAVMDDGVVENEMCPVFVGRAPPTPYVPTPTRSRTRRWEPWPEFREAVLDGSRDVSSWCREQVAELPADLLGCGGTSSRGAAAGGALTPRFVCSAEREKPQQTADEPVSRRRRGAGGRPRTGPVPRPPRIVPWLAGGQRRHGPDGWLRRRRTAPRRLGGRLRGRRTRPVAG